MTAVFANVKANLEAFQWTNPDGGVSSFTAVFDYDDYSNSAGSPFVVLSEETINSNTSFNKLVALSHSLNIEICVNYALTQPNGGTEVNAASQREAEKSLREAVQAMRLHLTKDTTRAAYLGYNRGFFNGYSFIRSDLPDLNIYRNVARMTWTEVVPTWQ